MRRSVAVAFLVLAILVGTPAISYADAPKTPCLVDLLVIRPVGAVVVVVSTVTVAVLTPFLFRSPVDDTVNMYREHVVRPALFVFTDPICSH